jgi:hypothetical protein
MSAVRHQSSYGGIVFNRVFGSTDPEDPASTATAYADSDYRLEVFDDSQLSIRDFSEPRQMMEGSEPNQVFENTRIVVGAGRILGSTYADLEDKVWALRDAFSPATVRRLSLQATVGKFPHQPAGVLPFDFLRDTAGGQVALRYYCRPVVGRPSLAVGAKGGLVRPFQFQLAAFDPRCYDVAQSVVEMGSITNPGNAVVYPQIALVMAAVGAATVIVRNVTTGHQVTLDLHTATAGAYWLMTEAGEIILDDGNDTNKYSLKKVANEFLANLYLVPGVNVWTISNVTGVSGVTFYFRGGYS